MAISKDIREPPCPHNEDRFQGCLAFVGGTLTYFINRRCKARLLWSFWHSYAESPFYEDPKLWNDFYPTLTSRQNWVKYCETTIIKDEDALGRDRRHPDGYRNLTDRLDFYVTKPEFAQAFRAVKGLGRKRSEVRVMEAHIFGSLRVVLLDDEQFGERIR